MFRFDSISLFWCGEGEVGGKGEMGGEGEDGGEGEVGSRARLLGCLRHLRVLMICPAPPVLLQCVAVCRGVL